MNVGMMIEPLAPSVQHAEKADLGAEMFGIGGDLQHGLGAGSKQQGIDDLLIVQCQPRQVVRQRKHDMEVADIEQFFLPLG